MKRILFITITGILFIMIWILEPSAPIPAFIAAVLLVMSFMAIYYGVKEIIRRCKNGEPAWTWQEEKPRPLPLWYRILSKFFR